MNLTPLIRQASPFPTFNGDKTLHKAASNFINMSVDDYFSDVLTLSFHTLKAAYKNPEHYELMKAGWKDPSYDSTSIRFGKMMHKLLLEFDDFDNDYFVFDDRDIIEEIGGARPTATNKYKEFKQKVEDANTHREIVSLQDYEQALTMLSRLDEMQDVHDLLDNTIREVVVSEPLLGIPYKGLIDALGDNYIVDYKTTRGALDPETLQETIYDYGYHGQLANYMRMSKVDKAYIVFQQTVYPYTPCIVEFSTQTIKDGNDYLLKMHHNFVDTFDKVGMMHKQCIAYTI